MLSDSSLLIIIDDKKYVKKIHMLRWRICGLKYVGVQDRALMLCLQYKTQPSSFEPQVMTDRHDGPP